MLFTAEGRAYDFSERSQSRSPLLSRCQSLAEASQAHHSGSGDETAAVTELPLRRDWLQAWEADEGFDEFDLGTLIGIAKVRANGKDCQVARLSPRRKA